MFQRILRANSACYNSTTTTNAANKICVVYGRNAVNESSTMYVWFKSFKSFSVKDKVRSGKYLINSIAIVIIWVVEICKNLLTEMLTT